MKTLYLIILICTLFFTSCAPDNADNLSVNEIDPTVYSQSFPNRAVINEYMGIRKTFRGDRNKCWLLTACEIIAYRDNYTPDEAQLFYELVSANYDDVPGNVTQAVKDITGTIDDLHSEMSPDLVMSFIKYNINNNSPVVIDISGHSVTVYGYQVNSKNTTLYYADGDDGRVALNSAKFKFVNGYWICGDLQIFNGVSYK